MAPSIFDLVGQSEKKRKRPAKKKKKTKKKYFGDKGWGTPEEKYRRLCLLAQLCRYSYYVHATNIIPDTAYDRVERLILKVEDRNRAIIDRWSPTNKPGSDKEADYPRSVQVTWQCSIKPRNEFDCVASVIDTAIKDVVEAFGVSAD